MKSRKLIWQMACLLGSITAAGAHADNTGSSQKSVIMGLGARYSPSYSGSDEWHTQVAPALQVRDGMYFFDTLKGVGYDLRSDNGFYLEHTLGYDLGRADQDSSWRAGSDKLKGMGNIKATVNTSIAAGWMVEPWLSLEGLATLPLSDGQGVHYRTSVTAIPVQNANDSIAFQVSALFGDSRYMNTFYGVSDNQSMRSGYHRYHAAGGLYGVESELSWSHQFTPQWGGALSVGYTWLGDHAANSPIVYQRDQPTVTAAITYAFTL
ncbi:MltA-interacting protein MipA [Serratia quinivorans]|jgi:outer membrane scaffolding protein for murein synthesis (MipA/OmpV family)|uniref:MipA/OmpV family protein n=1 Tax=Serratia TaxID=613 RepID=UPI00217B8418|nr:MipA/OmpV family protein [Serratia quinivorans]CAI0695541.1 MltA-interacting protein MipA [Serratia quinivorans]CAI0704363.1 MltA-interacting protein MipA [Serratia quinivorans]CAI0808254.1 MltA-interacting protein MipA [Serratia quinivorans]CAI0824646.1 MltA-interacting protein MipA [Serratia quinivorans]CAI1580583.1 MltA-interacting protein MipA [Serratia quinivorans]